MGLKVETYTVFEDGGVTRLGRIRGNDGSYITQAALHAITYKVFTMAGGIATPVEGGTGTIEIATSIYDSLQAGPIWRKDSGYNYRWAMPASLLAEGNTIYRVEVLFDPEVGENFWDVFNLNTLPIYSS